MHYIPLIDAGVSGSEENGTYVPYDEGVKKDIFIKDRATNQPFVGKVWNLVSTVWPDFTNPKTRDYYLQMMSSMHNNFTYDGIWIVRTYFLLVKINNLKLLIFIVALYFYLLLGYERAI